MSTRYEWDPRKEQTNRRKHGIAFGLAMRALEDPLAVTIQDRIENGERRWRTMGITPSGSLLVVAHTHEVDLRGEELVRIISARSATRSERKSYEEEKRRCY